MEFVAKHQRKLVLEQPKHAWLSAERFTEFNNLTVIIIFYLTTKAVFKPLEMLVERTGARQRQRDRMRPLLGANAFTPKTQKQRALADKKLFGCRCSAAQKSPFKE